MSEKETLVTIALKMPRAVFCLLTALQFYELTTQLPRQVWIAMPHGSRKPRIDYPPLQMIRLTGKTYSEGINTVVCDQVPIRIYSPAKTVVDCFKFRNKIGLDVALEALKDVLHQKKATSDELYHFAKIERVQKIILPYMEAMML
jgi:predicted transcriptional regulator of viral defense system